jgi:hypothetical protein
LCRIGKILLASWNKQVDQAFYTAAKITGGDAKTRTNLRNDKYPIKQLPSNLSQQKAKKTGIFRREYPGLQELKLKIGELAKWLPIFINLYLIKCMIILSTTANIV